MSNRKQLFTIGYQGLTFEKYTNELISNSIEALFDIRRHPVSYNPGFSKKNLKRECEEVRISYRHLPELSMAKEDQLLWYSVRYLPTRKGDLEKIMIDLDMLHRVAITTFNRHPSQCYRSSVAELINEITGCEIVHLIVG